MKERISVIICTYNRHEILRKTLESLLQQETQGGFNFDVVVVDNNSNDNTKTVVESMKPQFSGNLAYLFEPRQGKPYALNKGVKEAQGELVAFTDDDVTVDSQWLLAIVRCFQKFSCDCIGGRVLPVYPDNTPQWIRKNPHQAAGAVVIYDAGDGIKKFSRASMEPFIGANYAFKRKIFEECGLFRTDFTFGRIALGEDVEFINRLLKKDKVLYYCGDAVVRHPVDLKRARLQRIAQWHRALGKYAGRVESEDKGHQLVYLFGIPRYILRGIVEDFFLLIVNSFNRLAFFKHYRSFFRYIGMIEEYRAIATKPENQPGTYA